MRAAPVPSPSACCACSTGIGRRPSILLVAATMAPAISSPRVVPRNVAEHRAAARFHAVLIATPSRASPWWRARTGDILSSNAALAKLIGLPSHGIEAAGDHLRNFIGRNFVERYENSVDTARTRGVAQFHRCEVVDPRRTSAVYLFVVAMCGSLAIRHALWWSFRISVTCAKPKSGASS